MSDKCMMGIFYFFLFLFGKKDSKTTQNSSEAIHSLSNELIQRELDSRHGERGHIRKDAGDKMIIP